MLFFCTPWLQWSRGRVSCGRPKIQRSLICLNIAENSEFWIMTTVSCCVCLSYAIFLDALAAVARGQSAGGRPKIHNVGGRWQSQLRWAGPVRARLSCRQHLDTSLGPASDPSSVTLDTSTQWHLKQRTLTTSNKPELQCDTSSINFILNLKKLRHFCQRRVCWWSEIYICVWLPVMSSGHTGRPCLLASLCCPNSAQSLDCG